MPDLTVVIPARHEEWLGRTVSGVLEAIRADTEILVICDGEWPITPLEDDSRISIVRYGPPRGQRVAFNATLRLSRAPFVLKLDAHCAVDEGFDAKLLAPYQDGRLDEHTVTIPRMYNLHVFDWVCGACGKRTYQGPTRKAKPCPDCGSEQVERDVLWKPRLHRRTDFGRFDTDLKFQYWQAYEKRPEATGDLVDLMSSVGACWLVPRAWFLSLRGMDEAHGGWGQCGTEISCMAWLGGGRQVVNKTTWFAHLFRTQGGDFSWPYPITDAAISHARAHSQALWKGGAWPHQTRPLAWLVEKFWPVPEWTDADLAALQERALQGATT